MEFLLVDVTLRMVHFAGGLIWMGHNYVNVILRPRYIPFQPGGRSDTDLEGELLERSKREHIIFRSSSVVTWATGMLLLWREGIWVDAITLNGYPAVIGAGVWIGTIMMFNVWFVLWPHQKKVLGYVKAPIGERIRCSRITFLIARVNTVLSIPLLFFMASAKHGALLFV